MYTSAGARTYMYTGQRASGHEQEHVIKTGVIVKGSLDMPCTFKAIDEVCVVEIVQQNRPRQAYCWTRFAT